MLRPHLSTLLVAFAVLGAACRGRAEPPAPAGLSDDNIAAMVVTANIADILYAEMALAISSDPDVRAFATMMKKDHESVNGAVLALLTRLGATPDMSELAFDLRDYAQSKRLTLRDFEGFAFDSAYAANEVAYHISLLEAIDAFLIPAVRNAELRELLVTVRPAVAAHLEHARSLSEKKSTQ